MCNFQHVCKKNPRVFFQDTSFDLIFSTRLQKFNLIFLQDVRIVLVFSTGVQKFSNTFVLYANFCVVFLKINAKI